MGRKRPQRRRERGVWWYTRNNQRKKLNGRGWKESEESRGSGLQAVPLIQRFSGPLMGLVRENHQRERPGYALPIWAPRVDRGLTASPTSEASAMPVNFEALALCRSALYQRGLQERITAHSSSEREGPC